MKQHNPNPAGREGKPISLDGYTFDEVVRKALNTPVPKKEASKKQHKKISKARGK